MSDARRFEIEFRVRYGETDQMGVVYHPVYLVWCELGRTEYIRACGISYHEIEQRGTRLVVAEATVRYHAPARYDDILRIETTLSSVQSRALTFDYVVRHASSDQRLASARTLLVALDTAGRPAPMPRDVRDLLASAVPANR
jgi:acyl-CoA thioester hydrolase